MTVKEAVSEQAAKNLSLKKARDFICRVAAKSIEDRKTIDPLTATKPIKVIVGFSKACYADLAEIIPSTSRKNATTICFEADDFSQAYLTFHAL